MKIHKADKKDFEGYSILRKESLEYYKKISDEKLRFSDKQIKSEFEEVLSNPKRVLLIIEEDKNIKGFVIGTLIKNNYQCNTHLDEIYVDKKFRRRGFSKLLLNEFSKWSKLKKAKIVRLCVSVNNKKAMKFYKKIGFKIKHFEMEKRLS